MVVAVAYGVGVSYDKCNDCPGRDLSLCGKCSLRSYMSTRLRIAQTKLTCQLCGKSIPPGHHYGWVEEKRPHNMIKFLRVCPECKEQADAIQESRG